MMTETEIWKRAEIVTAPKCILFVEDNLDDFIAAGIALSKVRLRNKIARVGSADAMLGYLRALDQHLYGKEYPLPAAIIMDIGLPRQNGLEAQAMLRGNLRFRKIPIIAISSLERMEQLETAVKLGADAWMIKPFCAVQFLNIARDFNLDVEFENPISIEPPLLAVA